MKIEIKGVSLKNSISKWELNSMWSKSASRNGNR